VDIAAGGARLADLRLCVGRSGRIEPFCESSDVPVYTRAPALFASLFAVLVVVVLAVEAAHENAQRHRQLSVTVGMVRSIEI
jgi:hypothetical protein